MTDDINDMFVAVCCICKQVRKYTDDHTVQDNYHVAVSGELEGKRMSHGYCPACTKAMWLKEFGELKA